MIQTTKAYAEPCWKEALPSAQSQGSAFMVAAHDKYWEGLHAPITIIEGHPKALECWAVIRKHSNRLDPVQVCETREDAESLWRCLTNNDMFYEVVPLIAFAAPQATDPLTRNEE